MKSKTFKILASESKIDWTGRKVTGSHNGTIAVQSGNLIVEDDRLLTGQFVVDTTSIKILDITDAAANAQFAGHLASDDFFGSEKYPEAGFEISSALPGKNGAYQIGGDLTIKGITHPISFAATVNTNDDTLTAAGKMMVDRTKYDMKFRSGNFFQNLGDNLIYNEFELNLSITAKLEQNN